MKKLLLVIVVISGGVYIYSSSIAGGPDDNAAWWAARHPVLTYDFFIAANYKQPVAMQGWACSHIADLETLISDPPREVPGLLDSAKSVQHDCKKE